MRIDKFVKNFIYLSMIDSQNRPDVRHGLCMQIRRQLRLPERGKHGACGPGRLLIIYGITDELHLIRVE
jgi:hypothetical protein